MVDVRATLTDGKYHDTDSSEIAFKVAGSLALKEAAKPVLLEPVMAVEVVAPQEYLGDVIGDISRRRGRVEGQEPRGNAVAVTGSVPLSEMFGYSNDLLEHCRAAASTACSSTATRKCPTTSRRRSSRTAPATRRRDGIGIPQRVCFRGSPRGPETSTKGA